MVRGFPSVQTGWRESQPAGAFARRSRAVARVYVRYLKVSASTRKTEMCNLQYVRGHPGGQVRYVL